MEIDPDLWYTFSAAASASNRTIQWCTEQIVCYSDVNLTSPNAQWQLTWLNTSHSTTDARLNIRNRGKGPFSALAVFQSGNETQPGFRPLNATDPVQSWDPVKTGTPAALGWWFDNLSVGTDRGLAEREGQALVMASEDFADRSQIWIVKPVGRIDDAAWSSMNSLAKPGHQKSLSGGAIAGIVIGCLAAIGILLFLVFFWWRRRRNRRSGMREKSQNIKAQHRGSVTKSATSERPGKSGYDQSGTGFNRDGRETSRVAGLPSKGYERIELQ